jgi:ADP-L-glycero-D-manno-heptose 6-epimerase
MSLIVVTGVTGFIGSVMVRHLNDLGLENLVVSDEFGHEDKVKNLEGKSWKFKVHREILLDWLDLHASEISMIYHIGARTDTTSQDLEIFDILNLNYTKGIWNFCTKNQIPMIYASSAATYGMGEHGFKDSHDLPYVLKPMNPYAVSKNEFDKWALQQNETPPNWYGLKFFNVFGPNEYHKGRMASVIFHTAKQIKETGGMKLFKSHRPDFEDGHQQRDFIYVKDLVQVASWLMNQKPENGLYNLGTGTARTFLDLATNTFLSMGLEPNISFRETPEDIRDSYQYFTEADMSKLLEAGYKNPFYSLEEGIKDYIQNYLTEEKIY